MLVNGALGIIDGSDTIRTMLIKGFDVALYNASAPLLVAQVQKKAVKIRDGAWY